MSEHGFEPMTREEVERIANRYDYGSHSSSNSHQRRAHRLAHQLLDAMDALGLTNIRSMHYNDDRPEVSSPL